MNAAETPRQPAGEDHHPRGTLAVMALYGVLFVAGWFAVYVFIYLSRGAVTQ